MDISSLTLTECNTFVPYLLRGRNKDVFVIQKANDVLSEIENESDPRYLSRQKAILLRSGASRYQVGTGIRDIRGIYGVASGCIEPDTLNPVYFETLEDTIIFRGSFLMSGDADITGTATGGTVSTLIDPALADYEKDKLRGRVVRVTRSGVSQDRIISSNDPDDNSITFNGDLSAAAAAADTYLITNNYLIMEYVPYFTRFSAMESVLPLAKEFESLFIAGLIYKLQKNADETSSDAKEAEQEYSKLMGKYRIRNNTLRPGAPPSRARPMPALF